MSKKELDARGLSCPEPVILTMKNIGKDVKEIEIKVDTNIAKENVYRFLEGKKYSVNVKEIDNDFLIIGKK